MKEHPEVKQLMGKSPRIALWTVGYVAVIWAMAYASMFVLEYSVALWLLFAYVCGGTMVGGMTLAIHEIAHRHAFESHLANQILGYVADLGMLLPVSAPFRKYHMMHHASTGYKEDDVDIATDLEEKIFRGALGKALWLMLQPAFYSLRPMFVKPMPPTAAELIGHACCISAHVALYLFFGDFRFQAWIIASDLLGTGLHPTAGHFIAEHYTFADTIRPEQDTNSYYGFWNFFIFNAGYHTEHHDFPMVAWNNLKPLYQMAYKDDPSVSVVPSYLHAQWQFIFDPNFTLKSKVLRDKDGRVVRSAIKPKDE